ncbi:hypothetical protein V8C34DRAFT_292446 [Trichoderma compactum]
MQHPFLMSFLFLSETPSIPSSTAGTCCTLSPHSSLHHQATSSPKRIISPPKPLVGNIITPPFQRIMINRPVTPQMPAYTNTLAKTTHSPPPNHLASPFSRRRTDRQDGAEKQRTRMRARPPPKNQKQSRVTLTSRVELRRQSERVGVMKQWVSGRAYVRHEPV